jgi:hypothetical protein
VLIFNEVIGNYNCVIQLQTKLGDYIKMKKIGLFLAMLILAISLGAITAIACHNHISVYSTTGDNATVNCTLTGEDENWCYYDCTCTGTPARCDQMYAAAGLVDV